MFLLCGPLLLVKKPCTLNKDIIKSGDVLYCQSTRHINAGEEILPGFENFISKDNNFSGKENLDTVSLLSQQTSMSSPVLMKRPHFPSSTPLLRVRDPLNCLSNNVSRVEEQRIGRRYRRIPEDDTDEELLN